MKEFESIAKLLIMTGFFFLLIGGVLLLLSKFSIPGFRLPGDIFYRGEKGTFYFPIVTCIVISLILTILLNIFRR